MGVREHYENHLARFYSWMVGDLSPRIGEFNLFLAAHRLEPSDGDVAVDLGAGNGIQSLALARRGYNVVAIDFSRQLLNELSSAAQGLNVTVINDDIRQVTRHVRDAALVCCCGDTITHLNDLNDIHALVGNIYAVLRPGGNAIFSFRNYASPLSGVQRYIPVKSDDKRILTCILDYHQDTVTVTDLLYERTPSGWQPFVSSYNKVRLRAGDFVAILEESGFTLQFSDITPGMITVLASKPL